MGLAGCQGLLSSDRDDDSPQTTDPPAQTTTGTPSPTETATEQPRFNQEGTLYVEAADGEIGPQGFFDQGNVTEEEPDNHLTLQTQENGETRTLTKQEMRERYHFDQIYQLTDAGFNIDEPEILAEFPENLTDPEWRRNVVYSVRSDQTGVPLEEIEDFFREDAYLSDADLKTRVEQGNWDVIWEQVAHAALGGPSSNHDYIKSAALSAAEYYSADRETATFNKATSDGTHGLGFAITGATYEDSEMSGQETWGIETDPSEEQEIWDVDESESYPNRDDQSIFIEDSDPENGKYAWESLGMTRIMSENITAQFHGGEEFEDYIRNPDQQKGMKYIDSACIAAHINQEAHENGALPEFENATVDVYPDRIEYELAS